MLDLNKKDETLYKEYPYIIHTLVILTGQTMPAR